MSKQQYTNKPHGTTGASAEATHTLPKRSCMSLRRGTVSVSECVTSSFCCFSIGGMETTTQIIKA